MFSVCKEFMAYGRDGQVTESPRYLVQIFCREFPYEAVKIMPEFNLEERVGISHTLPLTTAK